VGQRTGAEPGEDDDADPATWAQDAPALGEHRRDLRRVEQLKREGHCARVRDDELRSASIRDARRGDECE
jgi:hypothetical protein